MTDADPPHAPDHATAVRLAVELHLGRETVADGDRLTEDLGADSFDLMNIAAILEEDLDIVITEQAAAEVRTVGDLVALVTSLVER